MDSNMDYLSDDNLDDEMSSDDSPTASLINENLRKRSIKLLPLLTITAENETIPKDSLIVLNNNHSKWLNENFKIMQEERRKNKSKGLYVIIYNNNTYNYSWMTVDEFKKKKLPNEYNKWICDLILKTENSLTLMFCDDVINTKKNNTNIIYVYVI